MTELMDEVVAIQVFRPTYEEFQNFGKYVQYIESQGAHEAGIVKVIPPSSWASTTAYNVDKLKISAPVCQIFTGKHGVYSQVNIRKKGMSVKEYKTLATSERYNTPKHKNYEELESKQWNNMTFVAPIHGIDVPGSLFNPEMNVWNVSQLGAMVNHTIEHNGNINDSANLIFGMWKATTAWHKEDLDLYSINYLHFGAPKTWYAISQLHAERFEKVVQKLFPGSVKCKGFLSHKTTLLSPEALDEYMVPFDKVIQEPGEFIITFPQGYHTNFDHGFNCSESTNFATPNWIKYGKRAARCICGKSKLKNSSHKFLTLITDHSPIGKLILQNTFPINETEKQDFNNENTCENEPIPMLKVEVLIKDEAVPTNLIEHRPILNKPVLKLPVLRLDPPEVEIIEDEEPEVELVEVAFLDEPKAKWPKIKVPRKSPKKSSKEKSPKLNLQEIEPDVEIIDIVEKDPISEEQSKIAMIRQLIASDFYPRGQILLASDLDKADANKILWNRTSPFHQRPGKIINLGKDRKFFMRIKQKKVPKRLFPHIVIKKNKRNGKSICPKCKREYPQEDMVRYHLQYFCGINARFACAYCDYQAKANSSIRSHIRQEHPGMRFHSIDLIKSAEEDKNGNRKEVSNVDPSEPEQREIEDNRFNFRSNQDRSKAFKFFCDSCKRGFADRRGIVKHIGRICGLKMRFGCMYCEFEAKQGFVISKHVRKYHEGHDISYIKFQDSKK